jgi:hypothetical protein
MTYQRRVRTVYHGIGAIEHQVWSTIDEKWVGMGLFITLLEYARKTGDFTLELLVPCENCMETNKHYSKEVNKTSNSIVL